MKRGRVDVGSKEGPPAEGVDFVGRVEAARLSAGDDPRRDFEACGGICGPNVAPESRDGLDDANEVGDFDASLRNGAAD